MIDAITERGEISQQLKTAVESHAPNDEKYPKANVEDVLEDVADAGYNQEIVQEQYEKLIQCGELYEVDDEIVGVV